MVIGKCYNLHLALQVYIHFFFNPKVEKENHILLISFGKPKPKFEKPILLCKKLRIYYDLCAQKRIYYDLCYFN